ncbi:hypothetical protein LCGC14_3105660, partial [marine sediment metagenome]
MTQREPTQRGANWVNKRQTTALWVGIVALMAIGSSAIILWTLSNGERRQLEDGRNLPPLDLSKVTLEPMDIWWAGAYTYLTYTLHNGTDRPLVEGRLTLYVRRAEDQLRGRAKEQTKRTLTWEEMSAMPHEAQ